MLAFWVKKWEKLAAMELQNTTIACWISANNKIVFSLQPVKAVPELPAKNNSHLFQ